MKKILTVVTTVYRGQKYLTGFLNNLLSIENREAIAFHLLLNEPTANEVEIVRSFQGAHPGVIETTFSNKLESIGQSLNKGFSMANTPLIGYSDVDDTKAPDAYIRMIDALSNAEVTYGDYIIVKKQGETSGRLVTSDGFNREEGLTRPIFGPTHCFRREVLDKVGYRDEQFKSGDDFEWQIRASYACKVKKAVGPITYYTRDGSVSASQTKWYEIDALKICLRYGLYDQLPRFQHRLPEIIDFQIPKIIFDGKDHDLNYFLEGYDGYLHGRGDLIGEGIGVKRSAKNLIMAIYRGLRYQANL